MSLRTTAVAALAALAFAGSAAAQNAPSNQIPCSAIDSIGTAEMANDGTITLHLQSLWPDPAAEAELVYAPDDPQYDEIKQHIGDIHPGDKKPVKPWC
ncbi:MAG TPA: hypothetical protein VL048_17685 [Xanthobacteraceae bacterium]|nr:hypothetical protein [Xanthobacteraceae bacterium]